MANCEMCWVLYYVGRLGDECRSPEVEVKARRIPCGGRCLCVPCIDVLWLAGPDLVVSPGQRPLTMLTNKSIKEGTLTALASVTLIGLKQIIWIELYLPSKQFEAHACM